MRPIIYGDDALEQKYGPFTQVTDDSMEEIVFLYFFVTLSERFGWEKGDRALTSSVENE